MAVGLYLVDGVSAVNPVGEGVKPGAELALNLSLPTVVMDVSVLHWKRDRATQRPVRQKSLAGSHNGMEATVAKMKENQDAVTGPRPTLVLRRLVVSPTFGVNISINAKRVQSPYPNQWWPSRGAVDRGKPAKVELRPVTSFAKTLKRSGWMKPIVSSLSPKTKGFAK